MKVIEFLSALQARGIRTNGLKAVLVSRLEEVVKRNVPLMQNHAQEFKEHPGGGKFAAGAYWKKLEPEAEVIDEEVTVYGIRF